MLLRTNNALDIAVRNWLSSLLPFFLVVFVVLTGFSVVGRPSVYRNSFLVYPLFLLVFISVIALARGFLSGAATFYVYSGWLCLVMLWNFAIFNRQRLLMALSVFRFSSLSVILVGLFAYVTRGFNIDTFTGRYSLGFENPLYFAQSLLVLTLSELCLAAFDEKHNASALLNERKLIIPLFLAILARARSLIVSIIVLLSLLRVRLLYVLPLLIILVFSSLFFVSLDVDLNSYSSGRLDMWSGYINNYWKSSDLIQLLFGASSISGSDTIAAAYSQLDRSSNLSVFRADNSYVEILVFWGPLVLASFFLMLINAYRAISSSGACSPRLIKASFLALCIQCLFVSSLVGLFAPLSIFASFCIGSFPGFRLFKI